MKYTNKAILLAISAVALYACNEKKTAVDENNNDVNPFFVEWKTPYGVPPFDEIKTEYFRPAFDSAMVEHSAEIAAIVGNEETPNFKNTIEAYDNSGAMLAKISPVFYGLNSANTNDSLKKLQVEMSPVFSKHSDDIMLNHALFQRIKTVYDTRKSLKLDADQMRLVEETYKDFVRAGANLDSADQSKLRDMNSQISLLQTKFGQNLLAETANFKLKITNKDDLAGLPADVAEAAKIGDSTWVFGLDNPTVMAFLTYADNRDLRKQIWTAYVNRCNNNNEFDNKDVIKQLVTLRLKRAELMGDKTCADFILKDRMAKTPAAAYALMNQVWTPALAKAKVELKDMETYCRDEYKKSIYEKYGEKEGAKMLRAEKEKFEVEAWDWRYYAQKVLKSKFNLSEEETKPYFKIDNVRNGIFYVAGKLYGVRFTEIKDIPKPHPDALAFECRDEDGDVLGLLYLDMYARPGQKRGGAWCGTYRSQRYKNRERIAPVVTIVANFTNPVGNAPALLSLDEAETFFHEFGHALNNLFLDVKYRGLAGVPRDFVELPSQIMEHWAFEPQVLKEYAHHYIDGKPIPQEIIDKLVAVGKYGQGFATTEFLASALLDMDFHTQTTIPQEFDAVVFEENVLNKKRGLIRQIPARHRSTYFNHTFGGGYVAGYYSYLWAEVLDADAFEAFVETGDIFNKDVATKFRKQILERGGSDDAMQLYINFRGKKPNTDALLRNRGLK